MPTDHNIRRLQQFLSEAQKCVIISHINPDGDALGSTLGWWGYLQQNYPKITAQVVYPNRFPEFLTWIEGAPQALIYSEHKDRTLQCLQECDLIFCMDFNTLNRLEELGEEVRKINVPKILIDHHLQPDNFDLVFSDVDKSSTCEFVYRIIEAMGDAQKMPITVAEALYTGILTDTGSFSHSVKTPSPFKIAAALMELGINKDAIAARVFDSYSAKRMQLLGYALKDKLQVFEDRHAAYIAISRQDLDSYKFEQGDTEGFVNYPLTIKGVVISAFFYESSDRSHVRVSLRSRGNSTSVNDLARQYFNGGGHFNASGGKFFGTLEECCELFEKIVRLTDFE